MLKSRKIVSTTLLSGVLVVGIGVVAFNTHKSLAAAGENKTTYDGATLTSTGTFRYDAGTGGENITIDSKDIYKVNDAVNALGEAVVNVTYDATANNGRGVVTFTGGGVR